MGLLHGIEKLGRLARASLVAHNKNCTQQRAFGIELESVELGHILLVLRLAHILGLSEHNHLILRHGRILLAGCNHIADVNIHSIAYCEIEITLILAKCTIYNQVAKLIDIVGLVALQQIDGTKLLLKNFITQ